MRVVDRGSGPPLVLVPGIQGRWEWMRPAVEALATRFRVITFSFADEPGFGGTAGDVLGLDDYVRQIVDVLQAAGLASATICGVSYGGLVAACFAARHPERTDALVLVSAIPPTWQPDARVKPYLRAPWLLAPVFCARSVRMYRELLAAYGSHRDAVAAAVRLGLNVVRHPFHPGRMARRATWLPDAALVARVRALTVPTLVVTGEDGLDAVVPPSRTREYLAIWPHAVHATLTRTGHWGFVTAASAFADVVSAFVGDVLLRRPSEGRLRA